MQFGIDEPHLANPGVAQHAAGRREKKPLPRCQILLSSAFYSSAQQRGIAAAAKL
jgi:hypothetical protein